jgi:hypothetical protein
MLPHESHRHIEEGFFNPIVFQRAGDNLDKIKARKIVRSSGLFVVSCFFAVAVSSSLRLTPHAPHPTVFLV